MSDPAPFLRRALAGRRLPVLALGVAVAVLAVVALLGGRSTLGAYSASIANSTNSAGTATYFQCTDAYGADKANALFVYKLAETSGTTAADSSGAKAAGTYQGSFQTTTATPTACPRDSGANAYVLNGTNAYVSTPTKYTNPTTFSLETWFKTTTASGKLMGFGNQQTGSSGQYDRHLYVTSGGLVAYGIYAGGTKMLYSKTAVTDGAWHHVVATQSPSAGAALYLDGTLVASDSSYTAPENTSGYWRLGYDNQGGWPNTGSNAYFTGQLRWAAVYSTALTATQVRNHWAAGRTS